MLETTYQSGPHAKAVCVLLVDDQPSNLLALEAILSPLAVNLVRAGSGQEALEWLLKKDFAAVLLDVQMPHMHGFETANQIRSRERSRNTPIIFCTAYESSESSAREAY